MRIVNTLSAYAKGKKHDECAGDLNDPDQQNEIFQIAKQMVKELSERYIR